MTSNTNSCKFLSAFLRNRTCLKIPGGMHYLEGDALKVWEASSLQEHGVQCYCCWPVDERSGAPCQLLQSRGLPVNPSSPRQSLLSYKAVESLQLQIKQNPLRTHFLGYILSNIECILSGHQTCSTLKRSKNAETKQESWSEAIPGNPELVTPSSLHDAPSGCQTTASKASSSSCRRQHSRKRVHMASKAFSIAQNMHSSHPITLMKL